MNDLEFKQKILDPKSSSFCAAKWYNATIWLGSGMTTSCHHPPAHLVDQEQVKQNPKLLHNTLEKKKDRQMMQQGQRPPGCEYCWKIEDMGRDAVSDRVYKSKIYSQAALDEAFQLPADQDVDLKTLEIAFDRTCQFACSYCNPAFSSTWVKDIKQNGAYEGLKSDGRNHFTHEHGSSQLFRIDEKNPYAEAFFRWWETDLHKTLQELRLTGGEPLMSGYTWRLIDWFRDNKGKSQTRLAINSNLGPKVDIERLLQTTQDMNLEIYTSMEAVADQAEYIRDGLDYQLWQDNVRRLLDQGITVHCMCTINALCLESLVEHLDYLLDLKTEYGRDRVNYTLNILRFPSFQSALVLSDQLRNLYAENFQRWLTQHRNDERLHEHEINHMQRLIDYLDVVKTPHSETFDLPTLHNDFKLFYQQYDQRRHRSLSDTFDTIGSWYQTL